MKKIAQITLFALFLLLGYQCHLDKPLLIEDAVADFVFTIEDNCAYAPAKVSFENKSTNFERIKWYFNANKPNDTSTLSTPTFTYLSAGEYDVKLEVTNKSGITSSKTQKISVKATETWKKTFTSSDVTYTTGAFSIQQTTNDGGYITTGFTSGEGAAGSNVVLIKTDPKGNQSWRKIYGGAKDDGGSSVKQTTDGGYIVLGYTASKGKGEQDLYLLKTNANGDTTWTKTYGDVDHDDGYEVQQTKDGGYILVGLLGGNCSAYIVKTDVKGDTLWTRSIKNTNTNPNAISTCDQATSVQETSDEGFMVLGINTTYSGFGKTDQKTFLTKINKNGSILWTKILTDIQGSNGGQAIQKTIDGGYVIVGYSKINNKDNAYLIKLNSEGIISFQKSFGNTTDDTYAFSVRQLPDKGYVFSGYIERATSPLYSLYVVRTDEKGVLIWERKIVNESAAGSEIGLTNDCGFIIATQGSDQDIHLLKLNKNGEL
jgi:PKD repeat protein